MEHFMQCFYIHNINFKSIFLLKYCFALIPKMNRNIESRKKNLINIYITFIQLIHI